MFAKKIWSKKNWGYILSPKICWSEKILVRKIFDPNKFWVCKFLLKENNYFIVKKCFGQNKIFGSKIILGQKNFGSNKNFETKKILGKKKL